MEHGSVLHEAPSTMAVAACWASAWRAGPADERSEGAPGGALPRAGRPVCHRPRGCDTARPADAA